MSSRRPRKQCAQNYTVVVQLLPRMPKPSDRSPFDSLVLGLHHCSLLIGIGEGLAKMVVECLLRWLVAVLRKILLRRVVRLLAGIELVDLTVLRVVVLSVAVAATLTLLVVSTRCCQR